MTRVIPCVCLFPLTTESLVVLEGVGVLLMTQRTWGGQTRQFLDAADIHSVFIHEVGAQS